MRKPQPTATHYTTTWHLPYNLPADPGLIDGSKLSLNNSSFYLSSNSIVSESVNHLLQDLPCWTLHYWLPPFA